MALAVRSLRNRVVHWLNDRPDDHILRWLFGVMVIATIAVTALDYIEMLQAPERHVQRLAAWRPSHAEAPPPSLEPGATGSRIAT